MPVVELINLIKRFVILEDGRILPITTFFNLEGEELPTYQGAALLVAGSDTIGWFLIPLHELVPIDLH